jgi:hypothetical protein
MPYMSMTKLFPGDTPTRQMWEQAESEIRFMILGQVLARDWVQ